MFGAIYPENPRNPHNTRHQKDDKVNPPTWRKKVALPLHSTGEEQKKENKYSLGETLSTMHFRNW
jgi:hypothetical protein